MAFKRISHLFQKQQAHRSSFQTGMLIDGRFELLAEIGRGGMGIVYQARDRQSGSDVALKVLDLETANDLSRDQFLREIQLTAGLSHLNLVNTLASGSVDGNPYMVMELVNGGSLADPQKLSLATVLELGIQVCHALEYIHAQGVIHHDLKPGNILLQKNGLRLTAKLMDFGLARRISEAGFENESGAAGSFFYLAPELIRGGAPSIASDLYALGVMLYELLTRRVPFSDFDEAAVLNQHLTEPPRPPSEAREGIPPELDALILRLLEKDPVQRLDSAAQARLALERIVLPAAHGNLPPVVEAADPAAVADLVSCILSERLVRTNDLSLAIAAAHHLKEQFRDGAWMIDLSAVTEPALVPTTAAQALNIELTPNRPLMVSLMSACREQNLLLLLANGGHISAARDQFIQAVLSNCPEVRVIVA